MLRQGSHAVPLIEYGAHGRRKRFYGSYYNDAFNPE